MVFIPSPQQAAVIDWTTNDTGSAFVEAVAGAGKTTTLLELLIATTGSVAFCAYNKKIADEIKAKLNDRADLNHVDYDLRFAGIGNRVRVGTFHSFGFAAWRRLYPAVKVDERIKRDQTIEKLTDYQVSPSLHDFIVKLASLAKQRGIGVNGQIDDDSLWYAIIDHFDLASEIDNENNVQIGVQWAKRALRYHIALAPKLIDFDDMIYMPIQAGVKLWENDWILVDEAQDTNPARRGLARKMLKKNGRAVFVGDRHQAIYGFTGADSDAIDQIIRDFNCTPMPLTITYRCPQLVVAEARKIVNHIQAHDDAPQGIVRMIEERELYLPSESLQPADAILCRNTQPLVKTAFQLIRNDIPCHVEGKDIGIGLLKLVNRYQAKTLDQLRDRLENFRDVESQKLIAKGKETQAEALIDRVETVLVIADNCQTIDDLRAKITSMFQDANGVKQTVTLSTVHKAKGREWSRVYLLGEHKYMPSSWARQDWQIQQEYNIIYVAYTRAQNELIRVMVED